MKIKHFLKSNYWKAESLIYEAWTSIMPVRPGFRPEWIERTLIISLTSYEPRFKKLHLTLKCLLRQEVRPDLAILWVSHKDYDKLPSKVLRLERRFDYFEIRTHEDIKSYKKLIPTLEVFPEAYIVTADDDAYYPKRWLSSLISHLPCTQKIIAHRAHKPKFKNGRLAPYDQWDHCIIDTEKAVIMPTGLGGVLYTPNCFSNQVLEKETFMALAPTADDLWFFWMASLKGTNFVLSGEKLNIVNWSGTDVGGLAEKNVHANENNMTIERLEKHFGQLPIKTKIN